MIVFWKSQGLIRVQGNGSIVLESWRVVGARVGGAVGVQSWIRQESQQLDGDLDNLTKRLRLRNEIRSGMQEN